MDKLVMIECWYVLQFLVSMTKKLVSVNRHPLSIYLNNTHINEVLIYELRYYYIPARIKIQVWFLKNTLIMRDSHKPRTRLILPFKMV
jgi:hypothetical protein